MNEFETAYQKLNEAQREAVDHIDGPLLVIAGPGTGKTQLLSVRVANILQKTDVSPENILCLTFTEVGASNMRHRLADFIGPEAYRVQIQTYHAFGSYILQEHRPDLTSAIDELEQFTIIREIQSKLAPNDVLRGDYHTSLIKSAIGDVKSAALTPDDLRKVAARNQADIDAVKDQIYEIMPSTTIRYPGNKDAYYQILEVLKDHIGTGDYIVGRAEPLLRICYRELLEIFNQDDGETKLGDLFRKWRSSFFDKDANNNYAFKTIANKKLISLANIMEEYTKRLDAAGLFDYNDMILQAIDLMEHDDEKRYNLQERFQYILLDEFQDTNDAQAKLVTLLTDNPSNEKPNIMAVGDDDQAIYGFQGASTSNFFDFDEHYHPHHVFLTKNYRSSAPILEFSHNVIEQGENRFCKAPNVNIDKHITAENAPAKTEITLREFKTANVEYSFVAKDIQRLINSGVPGNKIAIIAPKHKYLISILPYLHSLDIRVSYAKRDNILESAEIQEIINASKIILALAESPKAADHLWFQTLSLPCWGFGYADVIGIIRSAREHRNYIVDEMLASKDEAQQKCAKFFTDLAAKSATFSADYIVNALCVTLYPKTDDFNFFSNLNTLRDMLRAKSKRQKILLTDFIKLVDAYTAAEVQILDRSPYSESSTAVQLQTVHSAKGLEYDYVYLIASDNANWSDSGGNNNRFTFPHNLEYVRHTGDSLDEKLRVFFVAITRARSGLYLSYSLSDFAGKTADRLKFLDARETKIDGKDTVLSHIIPEPFNTIEMGDADAIEIDAVSSDKWFDAYLPTDEVKRELLRPRVEHYRISPTHINSFINMDYCGPEEFVKRYIIGAPGEITSALNQGTLIHETMDEFNKEQLSNEDTLKHFYAKINDADASEEEKDQLRQYAAGDFSHFLEERGDALRATKADSEHSFYSENLTLGDAILTGTIDRIEINEEDRTIVVADFKTGHAKSKWGTTDNTFLYKIQLYFYKFLIENSVEFRNYRVIGGRIDYISPDSFGNIAPLELEFDDATADEIKHLIQSVFHHVKTLELPDLSKISGKSNQTKALYDLLISESF